jgi:DNA-3-methyladenine glycosylase I
MTDNSLDVGDDGHLRCSWGTSTDDYAHYHDTEWGRPTTDERTLFEKICLEGFQSGLSWLTILRKRDNFRVAFADFDAEKIAAFGPDDIERLMTDTGIIRHRGKIDATINNAHRLLDLHARGTSLGELIWSFEPTSRPAPADMNQVAAVTAESTALARQLKKLGFRFVGPTTAYAAMQAMGVVNDHIDGCWVRDDCLAERGRLGSLTW